MLSKFFKPKAAPSPAETNDPVQIIGQATSDAAHSSDGKVLLYAEVEDGVISADIFSRAPNEDVRFRFAPEALQSLVYSYWEAEDDPSRRWATMAMMIEDGRFNMSFEYPDALLAGEDLHERRPRVVRAHFGDAAIDYSTPR